MTDDEKIKYIATSSPEEREVLPGYEAMAADEESEREALEWCEGLIGDAFVDEESEEPE